MQRGIIQIAKPAKVDFSRYVPQIVSSLLTGIQQILLAEYDDKLTVETEQDLFKRIKIVHTAYPAQF